MLLALRNSKSLVSGVVFLGVGGVAFVVGLTYPFGTAQRMGPGYFPVVLSGLLVLLGAINVGRAFVVQEVMRFGPIAWRQVLGVTAGVLSFALLITHFGLLVSVAALVVCGAFAESRFHPLETLLILLGLVLLAGALFTFGLGLPLADLLPHWHGAA